MFHPPKYSVILCLYPPMCVRATVGVAMGAQREAKSQTMLLAFKKLINFLLTSVA